MPAFVPCVDSADRYGQRLPVEVLVEAVRGRAPVGLECRGRAALEDVEPVDVVRLPDVDTGENVSVVGPGHVSEEGARAVERQGHVVVIALEGKLAVAE